MKLINAQQAAVILGLSKRRVQKLVADKRLKNLSPTRGIVLNQAEVLRFKAIPRPCGPRNQKG